MKIMTRNFGEIDYDEKKVIYFEEGIPGLEHLKKFLLFETETIFCYLQSIEDGDICFTIINHNDLKVDYSPKISESYFEKLGEGDNDAFALYVIVCFKESMEESTVNLSGPLLIHIDNRKGVQAIVEDRVYATKHKILDVMKEGSAYVSTK